MSLISIKTKFYIIFVLGIIIVQSCTAFEPTIVVYANPPYNKSNKQQQNPVIPAYNSYNQTLQKSYTTESYLHTYSAHELAKYFAQHGYSSEQVLRHHELYTNPEFIKLIKTYSGYEQYITYLNRKLQKKSGFAKWLGTWTDAHRKGFTKCVQQLCHELEQIKRSNEYSNQAKINVQQIWHQQHKILQNNEVADWYELCAVYQEYDCGNNAHIQRRCDVLEDTVTHGVQYVQQTYILNSDVQNILRSSGHDPNIYTSCYGNQFQQALHQECIELLNCATSVPEHSPLYTHKNALIDCIDAVREYNQAELVHKASIVADFCWSLLDYSKAVLEGTAIGIIGAAKDMIEHPMQTAACVVAGEYVLAYQLCKVMCNVADIGITALVDTSQAKAKWDDYIEPINKIISAIKNKEMTCRDAIKAGTAVAVVLVAQHKLLGGLNKFYSGIRAKTVAFTHNNPLLTPQQYMQMPDGLLLRTTTELNYVDISSKSISQASRLKKGVKKLLPKQPGMKGLIKKHQLPTKGRIRYVPPKNCHISEDLPRVKLANGKKGYIDKFGNIWVGGESRTKGQSFEWDVQLSQQGKQQLGWMTRDNSHLNVSLDGRVTHK